MPKKQKKPVKTLVEKFAKCEIVTSKESTPSGTVYDGKLEPQHLMKLPKLKKKPPPVFLHPPFGDIMKEIPELKLLIKKCIIHSLGNALKFITETYNDRKILIGYLEKHKFPYHTFGIPTKRKIKYVIRGLPDDVVLDNVKEELEALSIPVCRIHKMNTKSHSGKKSSLLLMVVVPYDKLGTKLIKVTKILNHDVTVEPPVSKPVQCFRCQKWGHSQRYCHGNVKCVKCAGDHFYTKCKKTLDSPPKCANCEGDHTANYKQCSYCPLSDEYVPKESHSHKKIMKCI